ncbi:2508_t:CDS:2 [Cetraspora pellucida]|uniref:2508_t:CDS:1 n=1 Tax=Cetraspora pellucida TaxID=1433469 RepID=A0A9N9EGH6_9GLOM|nr:2508_t:CDS:2 [Cetraspora pellucida]
MGRFWLEVFPHLTDEEGYNSFQQHFRITLATFNYIVRRLENHPAFFLEALNATPDRIMWPQGARLATVIYGFEYVETGLGNRRLPNVIKVIDRSHIPIHPPSKNGHAIDLLSLEDAVIEENDINEDHEIDNDIFMVNEENNRLVDIQKRNYLANLLNIL